MHFMAIKKLRKSTGFVIADRPSVPQAYQCKITQLTGMTPQTTRGVLGGK